MGKLKTTTLEEVSVLLCLALPPAKAFQVDIGVHTIIHLGMVVEVLSDHNISAKNQNIIVLIILDIDVTEL
jgi:hypothetical protein